jgi:hypothetical protein
MEKGEAAWLEEAERRYQAYRQGLLTPKPATEVFRESRTKLKQSLSPGCYE